MPNQLASQNGFGASNAIMPVTSSAPGPVNAVLGNVGIARDILSGPSALRITHIGYRVDLAPDVAAGSVNAPLRWRLLVMGGQLPPDVTQYQLQAFPGGAHPEIPAKTAVTAAQTVLLDRWLDFGANDPGLNAVASIDLADAGPTIAAGGQHAVVILIPIIDANLPQTLAGAANAFLYLEVYGRGVESAAAGTPGSGGTDRSLPRWDITQSTG